MGLFDGHSGTRDDGSTAELAKLLDVPVILVLDASKVARSVAAEVLGYQQFDPQVRIAGVVLNGIAGPSHLEFCKPQVEATTGLPVLGYMPYREDLRQPERHLGLIPTVEGTVVREWYRRLAAQIEETIDLDMMLSIAADTRTPEVAPTLYPTEPRPKRAAIAVAMDKAFSFYYQDSLDLLESWGADLMPFSPLEDSHLPRGAGGIYIGGGFPEMYVKELAENRGMIASIREAARQGIPIYAECGGLMYLGKGLTDFEGTLHSMAGLIPVSSSMPASRLVLGYREVEAMTEGPLLRRGQRVRGHEFHWSVQDGAPSQREAAYRMVDQDGRLEGFRSGSILASYVHLHLASDPSLASRFVEICSVE
jgi:cobyrinic acid a,c-diamide synthase